MSIFGEVVFVRARVLALLEDDQNTSNVQVSLESAGYEVVVCSTFVAAIQILQDHTFDLIISDVHLQNGGSVFDFLRWVKSHRASSQAKFVLFSFSPTPVAKYLSDSVWTSSRMLGAARYIAMDWFDPDLFCQQIAEVLPGTFNSAQDRIVI
jgi:CheY-like chemotaxis protein